MGNFLKISKKRLIIGDLILIGILFLLSFLAIAISGFKLGFDENKFFSILILFGVTILFSLLPLLLKLFIPTAGEKNGSARKLIKASLIFYIINISLIIIFSAASLMNYISIFLNQSEESIMSFQYYDLFGLIFLILLLTGYIIAQSKITSFTLKDTQEKLEERIKNKELKKNEKLALAEQKKQERLAKHQSQIVNADGELVANPERSYFDGKLYQLVFYNMGWNLLNIITLGIMVPFTICWKLQWKYKHTVYSGKRLVFKATGFSLIKKWIIWSLLTIITLGIFAFFLVIKLEQWKAQNTVLEDDVKEN